jgi:hypothetical protein
LGAARAVASHLHDVATERIVEVQPPVVREEARTFVGPDAGAGDRQDERRLLLVFHGPHFDRGRLPAAAGRHGDEREAEKIDWRGRFDLKKGIEDRERLAGSRWRGPSASMDGREPLLSNLSQTRSRPALL